MKVQYPEIQIALDDVITAFHKMQKNRGHPVTQDHINKFKAFDWTQSQINPLEVINPYDNFRDIPLSRNGLTMKEVLCITSSSTSFIVNPFSDKGMSLKLS